MKRLYDRRSEQRVFSPGDLVLALLPIVSSPFQAKYMGPYTVVKQLSHQNYLIATPEHRKHHQLCHINLLKAYHPRVSDREDSVLADAGHPMCVCNTIVKSGESCEDGLPNHDSALLTGRLKNSEVLADLNNIVGHLPEQQSTELKELRRSR